MEWFESRGVKLKIENDNVFSHAQIAPRRLSIVCLMSQARDKVWLECTVTDIKK